MHVQWHGYWAVIVRQSHGNCITTVCRLTMCHCCIFFYMFELPSQSKMSSCTCLVHECPKYMRITQPTYDLCMASVLKPPGRHANFYAQLRRMHDDCTISVQSPHVLSTALHRSIVETRQINRTMAVKNKNKYAVARSYMYLRYLKNCMENRRQINCTAPRAIVI